LQITAAPTCGKFAAMKLASNRRLRRSDLPIDTAQLARFLIGKTLGHETTEGRTSGRIVETEAYVVGDAAGHAYVGETARNRSLFLERGHAYVYLSYGVHWCFNVSAETARVGAGVLVRALEPLEGIELMQARRGTLRLVDLARGPGRLAAALGIDRRVDAADLCGGGALWLGSAHRPVGTIGRSVRIGITKEVQRRLRFYERGNAFVSGTLALRR
jgi:DNA-3-methyladenine glycosylase